MPKINKMNMFGDPNDNSKSNSEYSVKSSKILGISKSGFEYDSEYQPLRGEVFRRWMSNKEICKRFLESLCGKAVSIKSIESEKSLSLVSLDSREIRLDVYAEDENFNIYNIEAQARYYKSHNDRCLYYFSRIFSSQLKSSMDFDELRKTTVIFINLNNPQSKELVDEIELRHIKDPSKIYTDKLKIIEINLGNLISATDRFRSDCYDKNLFLFLIFCLTGEVREIFSKICFDYGLDSTNFSELRDMLSNSINKIKGELPIDELNLISEPVIVDSTEVYKMLTRNVWIYEGIEIGIEKGEEIGIEKGIEKGIEIGEKRGSVKTLFNLGYSSMAISETLKLPLDFVTQVIDDMPKINK